MDFILLQDNRICLIDESDTDLKEFSWHYHNGYVKRKVMHNKVIQEIMLHKVVIERKLGRPVQVGLLVDHKSMNTCDNRRDNLREATKAQNAANGKSKGFSKYRGVTYISSTKKKRQRRWVAEVFKGGKRAFRAVFHTEEEAAKAYDENAKLIHGEFARLNFPLPY